jgi:deoxyribodipyrimidine photo-lyase
MQDLALFWFRRDLRLHDNAGLFHALQQHEAVLPIFIFDPNILSKLRNKQDRRVDFIHQALAAIDDKMKQVGSGLSVMVGTPEEVWNNVLSKYNVRAVYANHDYEPYARARDEKIKALLASKNISFTTFKDQCVFEKSEVVKDDGLPYTVFTPYSRKWKKTLLSKDYQSFASETLLHKFMKTSDLASPLNPLPSLATIGFEKTTVRLQLPDVSDGLIRDYAEKRDLPALHGTSRLSMHLRFGTISVRALVARALPLSETWLNELIWRDFYMMILWHFPHAATGAFKKEYNQVEWLPDEVGFKRWCEGTTGFPIVDAGMRELNATGFMHNRVRMIVSSFLVKDLLVNWQWGEAYFAEQLNDFDLSANNGGWQWAAGTGCDAAPYFRIFNPYEQQKKFDPKFDYIRHWVPEYNTPKYPAPMVDHAVARNRTLAVYKDALSGARQQKLF